MRKVICHYHIFKNAGTSFGHMLDASFGVRHLSFDGPFPFFTIDQEQLDRIILRKTDAVAFSSHQIQLPAPVSRQYRVLAVVFLRDPMLRLASLWRFKRQAGDGTDTAAAAGRLSFADWLGWSLDHPQEVTQVSNGQTRALAARFRERPLPRRVSGHVEYDLGQARANLAGAGFVGRADHFAHDLARIAAGLKAAGLPLSGAAPAHLNSTAGSGAGAAMAPTTREAGTDRTATVTPEARAEAVLAGLPPALADRITAANAQDRALYAEAVARNVPHDAARCA